MTDRLAPPPTDHERRVSSQALAALHPAERFQLMGRFIPQNTRTTNAMNPVQLHFPLTLYRRVIIGKNCVGVDPDLHHLAKVNGVWCVRVTIDRGPKLVGQRVKVSLGTGDAGLAKLMRDKIMAAYNEAGVKIVKPHGRSGMW